MDDSWSPVNLGDIYTPGRGISYSANDLKDVDGTGLPFITIKNFNKGGGFNHKGLKTYSGPDFPQHRLVTAALLIANTDVTRDAEIIGAPLLVPKLDDQPLFSMDVNQLTQAGKIGCVDPQYIFFRLCIADARSHMQRVSAGSTVLHLNVKDALKFKFDLPPVQEQTKIAQILGTLDAQIQKTEALITKLEKIKEGLLHDMLTRGIDQNGQLRPTPEQAPEIYKESVLGLIPKEWETARINEVSTKVTNGFVGVATPHYTEDNSGALYLFGNNIRPNYVDLKKCERITKRFHKLQSKSQLKDGDMLTVQSGHIGTCAVYEESIGDANCHALIITRFKPEQVKSKFVALYCNSRIGMQAQSRLFIGSTILHINTSDLAKLAIPILPMREQDEIIRQNSASVRRLSEETSQKNKLINTKKGLMDDLLTGHVRVTALLKDEA